MSIGSGPFTTVATTATTTAAVKAGVGLGSGVTLYAAADGDDLDVEARAARLQALKGLRR